MMTLAPTLDAPLRRRLPLYAAVLALALGTAALRWLDVDWAAIASLGYAGLFLANLAASATVVVPVPGVAAAFLAGQVLDPVLVGLSAGAGATLGELSGYLLGRAGRAALNGATTGWHAVQRLPAWIQRYGFPAVLLLAFIPNPLFDVAGMAAGTARMSPALFLLATFIGKSVRMALIALAGQAAVQWVAPGL